MRMRSPARRARPELTAEEKAAKEYEAALQAAGGNRWVSGDLAKRRIYFNDVVVDESGRKMTVFYDCITQQWQSGKYAAEAVIRLRNQINL